MQTNTQHTHMQTHMHTHPPTPPPPSPLPRTRTHTPTTTPTRKQTNKQHTHMHMQTHTRTHAHTHLLPVPPPPHAQPVVLRRRDAPLLGRDQHSVKYVPAVRRPQLKRDGADHRDAHERRVAALEIRRVWDHPRLPLALRSVEARGPHGCRLAGREPPCGGRARGRSWRPQPNRFERLAVRLPSPQVAVHPTW